MYFGCILHSVPYLLNEQLFRRLIGIPYARARLSTRFVFQIYSHTRAEIGGGSQKNFENATLFLLPRKHSRERACVHAGAGIKSQSYCVDILALSPKRYKWENHYISQIYYFQCRALRLHTIWSRRLFIIFTTKAKYLPSMLFIKRDLKKNCGKTTTKFT